MATDGVRLADLEIVVRRRVGVEDELANRVGVVDRSDPTGGPAVDHVELGKWLNVEVVESELGGALGGGRPGLPVVANGDGDHAPGLDDRCYGSHTGYVRVDYLEEVLGYRKAINAVALADRGADHEVELTSDVDCQFVERVAESIGEKEGCG